MAPCALACALLTPLTFTQCWIHERCGSYQIQFRSKSVCQLHLRHAPAVDLSSQGPGQWRQHDNWVQLVDTLPLKALSPNIFNAVKIVALHAPRLPEYDPPTGLGAHGRQAGAGAPRRAPLARTRHPPSGGLVSGAVVVSSARGTWGASAAYHQCPNHPEGWGGPAGTARKAPRSYFNSPGKQLQPVETTCSCCRAACN
jgi:hypothetical protein